MGFPYLINFNKLIACPIISICNEQIMYRTNSLTNAKTQQCFLQNGAFLSSRQALLVTVAKYCLDKHLPDLIINIKSSLVLLNA